MLAIDAAADGKIDTIPALLSALGIGAGAEAIATTTATATTAAGSATTTAATAGIGLAGVVTGMVDVVNRCPVRLGGRFTPQPQLQRQGGQLTARHRMEVAQAC